MASPINVNDLTKMLQCGICKKTLSDPKSLRCSHSFCKLCLDGLIEFIEGGSGVLKCPNAGCEKCSFISSDQTTNDLHVDYIVKGVVDMVKKTNEEEENAKNFQCDSCKKGAKKYCIRCKVYKCEACVDEHDDIKDAFVSVQFQENKLKIFCKEHWTEANYTCTCGKDEFICVYCVHRTHKNHNYETFTDAEKTLKGLLVNKITFSEDLDLQWSEAQEDMSTARSYLHEILLINKINCINDYVDFVNKEEENLKYDFDLLTSFHTKSFSTTVDSIEFFKECLSRETMDILLERSEIINKLNTACKSRKIPEVTVSLTEPCFNEKHPLGEMNIRVYGKRFFVGGSRKTFKSEMPEPNVKDPSLKTLERLLKDVLYMPSKKPDPEASASDLNQSSIAETSQNIEKVNDGDNVTTDTQGEVVQSTNEAEEGDVVAEEGDVVAGGTEKTQDEGKGTTDTNGEVESSEKIEKESECNGGVEAQAECSEKNEDISEGTAGSEDQVEDPCEKIEDAANDNAEVDSHVTKEGTERSQVEGEGETVDISTDIGVTDVGKIEKETEEGEKEEEEEEAAAINEEVENTEMSKEEVDAAAGDDNQNDAFVCIDEVDSSDGDIEDKAESNVCMDEDQEMVVKKEDEVVVVIPDDTEDIARRDNVCEKETERIVSVEGKPEVGIVKFEVENVSKIRNTVLSDPVMIQNLQWKIMLMPQYSENDGGKIVRNAGIFVQCDPEQDGSSWLCQAHGKITLKNHKYDDMTKKITEGIFTNEHSCWGHSSFVSWVDIMDIRKGYNKGDRITIEAIVEVDPPLFFKTARVYSNAPNNERDTATSTRKRKLSDKNDELLNLLLYRKKEKQEECDYSTVKVDRGFRNNSTDR